MLTCFSCASTCDLSSDAAVSIADFSDRRVSLRTSPSFSVVLRRVSYGAMKARLVSPKTDKP